MKQRSRDVGLSGATIGSSDEDRVMSSRRRLLRHAAGSIPVIMTLNSGAAFAAASSLLSSGSVGKAMGTGMGEIQNPAMVGSELVCLHDPPSGLTAVEVDGVIKYQQPITGCLIPDDTYTLEGTDPPETVSAVEVCVAPSTEKFAVGGETIDGQNGLLVSAMAFSSVAPILGDCRDSLL